MGENTLTVPQPKPAPDKTPPGESCGTCVFSLDTGNVSEAQGKQLGAQPVRLLKCRRFPPAAFPLAVQAMPGKLATPGNPQGTQIGSIAIWPDVAPAQWCGEWGGVAEEPEGGDKGADKGT